MKVSDSLEISETFTFRQITDKRQNHCHSESPLNSFLSNIVNNMNILRYSEFDSVTENIAAPIFKAIFKYKDHSSKLATENNLRKERFVS